MTSHKYAPRRRCSAGRADRQSDQKTQHQGQQKGIHDLHAQGQGDEIGYAVDQYRAPEHPCGEDQVKPGCIDGVMFQGVLVARHLSEAPGGGQGDDDGRHHGRAEDAQAEDDAPEAVAGVHFRTVEAWLSRARQEDEGSLDGEKKRGRPVGACRKLTMADELWLREQITEPRKTGAG